MLSRTKPQALVGRGVVVLLALATSLLVYAVAEAAWTAWDCEGSTGIANSCPSDAKYSRAALDYTITGGSGSGTDWTINQRPFAGSTGGNTGPYDKWKLGGTQDFKWNGSSWALLGSTGGGSWRTDATWSPTFTVGSPRNVTDSSKIRLVTQINHQKCVWQYIPPNYYCNTSDTWTDTLHSEKSN